MMRIRKKVLIRGLFFIQIYQIAHFTVVYLVAEPLIWSEAEGDLVMIETSI